MQTDILTRQLNRRRFVASVAAVGISAAGVTVLGGCGTSARQAPPDVPRIGVLYIGDASGSLAETTPLREGLREQGLVEGRDLIIEFRYADGQQERLPLLA